MKNVPFLDLQRLFLDHREEFMGAIARVLEQAAFIDGPEVTAFEANLSKWLGGGSHAVACANGTDAITLAVKALALPPDAEAIVPAMTYFATAAAIVSAGVKVDLVDVSPGTWLLDPRALEAAITPRTKLIAAVHLYGQMAEMDRLRAIADRHGCFLLEDAAQCHGGTWRGKVVGELGDAATFSFYPGKNLGAFGDGGAMVFRDAKVARRARALGHHGGLKKYEHDVIGFNSRLDSLQAAVLNIKLKYIDAWNDRRRAVARAYDRALTGIGGLELPREVDGAKHTYHLYVVLVEKRDDFRAFLEARGIDTIIHYPKALHEQKALATSFVGRSFPQAERVARHAVSLPMCPTLDDSSVERVISAVRAYFGKGEA